MVADTDCDVHIRAFRPGQLWCDWPRSWSRLTDRLIRLSMIDRDEQRPRCACRRVARRRTVGLLGEAAPASVRAMPLTQWSSDARMDSQEDHSGSGQALADEAGQRTPFALTRPDVSLFPRRIEASLAAMCNFNLVAPARSPSTVPPRRGSRLLTRSRRCRSGRGRSEDITGIAWPQSGAWPKYSRYRR